LDDTVFGVTVGTISSSSASSSILQLGLSDRFLKVPRKEEHNLSRCIMLPRTYSTIKTERAKALILGTKNLRRNWVFETKNLNKILGV